MNEIEIILIGLGLWAAFGLFFILAEAKEPQFKLSWKSVPLAIVLGPFGWFVLALFVVIAIVYGVCWVPYKILEKILKWHNDD